jgi:hypothetical protein
MRTDMRAVAIPRVDPEAGRVTTSPAAGPIRTGVPQATYSDAATIPLSW